MNLKGRHILPILLDGNPKLRQVAQPVCSTSVGFSHYQELIGNMIVTMRDAGGIGLAAPQVGEMVRLIVMENETARDKGDRFPLTVMINPVVLATSKYTIQRWEGCLSVPEVRGEVTRPLGVTVEYLDETGRVRNLATFGLYAVCIQHEIDHLDGVLFIDKLDGDAVKRGKSLQRKDNTDAF